MRRKVAITLLVVLLLSPVALFLYARSAYPPERLQALLQLRLEAAIGHPVQIGSIRLSALPPAVRVDHVRVEAAPGFASPALLDLQSLRFNIKLLPLLRRRIVAHSIEVESPHVWLEQSPGRTWNFASAPHRPASIPARGAAQPFAFTVEALHITDGRVQIWSAPDSVALEGPLEALLRLETDRDLRNVRVGGWIESAALTGGGRGALRGLHDIKLRAEPRLRVSVPDSSADVEQLRLILNEAAIDLQGQARRVHGQPELHLQTRAEGLDLSRLLSLVPRSASPQLQKLRAEGQARLDARIDLPPGGVLASRGQVQLQRGAFEFEGAPEKLQEVAAQVDWSGDSLRVREVSARLGQAPLHLSGLVLQPMRPLQARYDFHATGQLDLAKLAAFVPMQPGTRLSGALDLDVRARGRVARRDSVWLEGPVTLRGVTVQTPQLLQPARIQASLRGTGERLRIETARVEAGSSELALTGWLRPALPPRRPRLEVEGRATKLDLVALLPPAPVAAASGSGAAVPALLPVAPPIDLQGRIEVGELVLTGAVLHGVRMDLQSLAGVLTADLRAEDLRADQVVLRSVQGRVQARGATGSGHVSAARAQLRQIEATGLESDLQIVGRELRFPNPRGTAYDGTLSGAARVDLANPAAPRFDMQVRATAVDANTFLGTVTPLRNAVYGTLNLESSWSASGPGTAVRTTLTGNGKASSLNGRIEGIAILNQLASYLKLPTLQKFPYRDAVTSFEVRNGRMHLPSLYMHGGDADAGVAGSIGLDGSLDLGLELRLSEELTKRYLRGQALGTLGSLFSDPSGRLAFDFKVTGPYKAPKVVPDLRATASHSGVRSLDAETLRRLLGDFTQRLPQTPLPTTREDAAQEARRRLGGALRDAFGQKVRPPGSTTPDSALRTPRPGASRDTTRKP